jgi:hypothetical protein
MKLLASAAIAGLLLVAPTRAGLPASSLSVEVGGEWREWWRAEQAPERWREPLPLVAGAVRWKPAGDGLAWGELPLAGSGEAWRLKVILVRLDPQRHRLRLVQQQEWSVGDAPASAVLAFNAGQFAGGGMQVPWGWVVRGGLERRTPGRGPLSSAFVVDQAGRIRWAEGDSAIAAARAVGGAFEAFQSYPTLLTGDGDVPAALRDTGRGVSVAHRDSRLAIGELRDGQLLIALTRFDALPGGALGSAPFGPTAPEMAALMGALGCRHAVMLDGGLSGQLLLRTTPGGTMHLWRGWRTVPLGMVVERVDGE